MEKEKELKPYQGSLVPFDPIVLVRDAMSKWALILVVAVVFGMFAYIYTDTGYVPYYDTRATLVLTTRGSASTVYNNLDSTSSLATVFSEILNSSVMRNNILDELGMDSFNGSIYASAVEETNLLTVQVRAGDPRTAFQVMKVLLDKHEIVTYEVIGDIVLEVLEHPSVPTRATNAVNSVSSMIKVMVVTAAAVFILALIKAYFRDVVRSKEEADQKLDCWCLGEIRHEKKKQKWKDILARKKSSILITKPETGFRYVTTMSKLRRRVEQHMHGGKLLMVTSVVENEGKSTVSTNLALAMAKKYSRVLLIDLDLHKPGCRKIMEQEIPGAWTHEVIRGEARLSDAVVTDKLSRLDILFAKHCTPQEASDLVNSDGLRQMLEEARRIYDFVVIDLPPMAIVPDPEAVMEHVDASLLVVRQDGVAVPDLNRAIMDLQRGKAKMIGCVLNNVYSTEILSGEGYGTGYGRYGGYSRYGRYGKYGRYAAYTAKQNDQ